jgi:hypothetical protein
VRAGERTPAPPSTGTGLGPDQGAGNALGLVFGLVVLAMSSAGAATVAVTRRR